MEMCQYSTTLNAALTAIQTHLHQTIVTIRWIFWHYPGIVFEVEQASCYPLNLKLGDDNVWQAIADVRTTFFGG